MADKLVFDLSQEVDSSPQIFIKKDWLNLLDNMNGQYGSNQMILDTSSLSTSNKYMSYREAYLSVPINMCLTCDTPFAEVGAGNEGFSANTATTDVVLTAGGSAIVPHSVDYAMGLKNWFGSIFHSLTLDLNGQTIIQQTPFINMVNMFKLQTSLSWGDIETQGKTIGFYPDTVESLRVISVAGTGGAITSTSGIGACYTTVAPLRETFSANQGVVHNFTVSSTNNASSSAGTSDKFANFSSGLGNRGLLRRIQGFAIDPAGVIGTSGVGESYAQGSVSVPVPISSFLQESSMTQLWKGYIFNKGNGIIQSATVATVYLKHLHNFFAVCPLLKGTFFKLTAFLNNASTSFTISGKGDSIATVAGYIANDLGVYTNAGLSVSVPVGGVNPLMLSDTSYQYGGAGALGNGNYIASVQVGNKVLTQQKTPVGAAAPATSQLSSNVYMYIPAYSFNPIFEQAYLSQPIKTIKYSDYYQYQVINIPKRTPFNNLLTNGIAGLKSILIIPFYSSTGADGAVKTGLPQGMPCYQSPFDIAGCGGTSPLCMMTNFNVVVSGQNQIYNTQMRAFEQFNHNQKGCHSVNSDMTDGLTSGLITEQSWLLGQSYWYVNLSRMLPIEEMVPKSVQIIGQNLCELAVDLFCFLEYEQTIAIDVLSGQRV